MGKNLIQQRRGKGSIFRAPSFRYVGKVGIRSISNTKAKILDIIHCPGHSGPLIELMYEDKQKGYIIAPEGVKVGEFIHIGEEAQIKSGNIIQLKNIPEGTLIYNIEVKPGDGGKLVRAAGTFAKVVSKLPDRIVVELPSKKQKYFNPKCRAIIGVVAGGGKLEKPLLKAGNAYYKMRAKNRRWPKVSGTSMNAVAHPFGGSRSSHKGKINIAPRNAPPGRKVGKLRPKKTGRKKIRIKINKK